MVPAVPDISMRKLTRKQKQSARIRPYAIALGLAGTLALLAFSISSPSRPESKSSALNGPKYVLKLNGPISASSAGVLVAVSDGLFAREGIEMELATGSNDADAISAATNSGMVVGLSSAVGFLKARADGAPIVAFATAQYVGPIEFFSLPTTRIATASDLEGKRIAYPALLEASVALRSVIEKNSIAQSRISVLESKAPVSDLLSSKVDIVVGRRDIEGLQLDRAGVDYRSVSPSSFGVQTVGAIYFANERAFARPRDLQKIISAIANGWTAAYSEKTRAASILSEAINSHPSPESISAFLDAHRRYLRPLGARFGELDARRLRSLQTDLVRQRIVREPIDLTRAVNYDIISEAYRLESKASTRIEP